MSQAMKKYHCEGPTLGGSWVPLLNFERGSRSQGPEVPGPGVLVPLYTMSIFIKQPLRNSLRCVLI